MRPTKIPSRHLVESLVVRSEVFPESLYKPRLQLLVVPTLRAIHTEAGGVGVEPEAEEALVLVKHEVLQGDGMTQPEEGLSAPRHVIRRPDHILRVDDQELAQREVLQPPLQVERVARAAHHQVLHLKQNERIGKTNKLGLIAAH